LSEARAAAAASVGSASGLIQQSEALAAGGIGPVELLEAVDRWFEMRPPD